MSLCDQWREAARATFEPGEMPPIMAEAFREVAARGADAAVRVALEALMQPEYTATVTIYDQGSENTRQRVVPVAAIEWVLSEYLKVEQDGDRS